MTGRCRAGKHCLGGDENGPTETPAPLCAACVHDIEKCLTDLPHLARVLRYFVRNKARKGDGPKITRTPEPPCPLDVNADSLLTDVYVVVDRAGGWKTNVSALANEGGVEFLVWSGGYQEVQLLEGWRRALDLRRVHRRVNDFVGLERTKIKRHCPCPSCGLTDVLWSWIGEDTVRCTGCPALLTGIEYDEWAMELLKEMR